MPGPMPQRLQLTRRKGFDLQAHSLALNGLPARSIARPGPWGNPFAAEDMGLADRVAAQAKAVGLYRRWVTGEPGLGPKAPPALETIIRELGGHNLACWCAPGTPCHADVLLAMANSENAEKR